MKACSYGVSLAIGCAVALGSIAVNYPSSGDASENTYGGSAARPGTIVTAELGNAAVHKRSVWSGVYTSDQHKRGEEVHRSSCVQCHGERLNGTAQPDMPPSPAIARVAFLRKWSGRNAAELAEYVRTKMPPDAPGRLTPQETADAIAHMLATSNIPAGAQELPTDPNALSEIVIEAERK